MSQRYSIQRLDLRLRAEFPSLQSEIYEFAPRHHVIYVPSHQLNASEFGEKFQQQYRQIGDRVELLNERPVNAVKIDPISDRGIGDNLYGIYLNRSGLITVLSGMFPELPPITSIEDGRDHILTLGFLRDVPENLRGPVEDFLSKQLHGRQFQLVVSDAAPKTEAKSSDRVDGLVKAISGLDFKPIYQRQSVPNFVREEEEWWFANLEKLFAGRISPRSFGFTQRLNQESACYLHSTQGPQLDLRQALLAYDVVYMELPLEDDNPAAVAARLPSFWDTQNVTKSDLLRLVELDRVRLVRSQPEERSDLGLLREAHEVNSSGVVGRRVSAAMMIADIVETADEFLITQPQLQGEVLELIERLANETKVPASEVARFLFYPLQARRECLEPLLGQGLMAFSGIGQGKAFADAMQRVREKDLRLEAGSFGQGIHTAHMLDATFIPHMPHEGYVASWMEPMRLMGARMNFYRSFNNRIAAAWVGNERRRIERKIVLPPVPLFMFGDRYGNNIPLKEIIELTSRPGDRRKGRALITRLASLPDEERAAEVASITVELGELDRRSRGVRGPVLLADAGINLATYALNLSVFPFIPAITILYKALELAKKAPVLHRVVDELDQALNEHLGRNEDLSFLSKIDRVATLSISGGGDRS